MKKLINEPTRVTREMLDGMVAMNCALALLEDETVVIRSDVEQWRARGQVALISGGGAGHEPAHAGYVGEGMLTAAVAGEVFTSPSTDAVLAAIRTCATAAGVLLIIKNYTGDRLNFGLAAELARAEGFAVEVVIVADDAAFEQPTGAVNNRRGIAGTVFVHKVAGAAAAAGLDLARVKAEASRAAQAVRTMGVALSACTVPAVGSPGFELAETEIELGLGIHGERGIRRSPLVPADEIAAQLIDRLVADSGATAGSRVVLLVNNLGATPLMELSIVARAALHELRTRQIRVERVWCGTFLSAIDMAGCSISILPVDPEVLSRLDAATSAPAWVAAPAMPDYPTPIRIKARAPPAGEAGSTTSAAAGGVRNVELEAMLQRVATALLEAEDRLTAMDQAVGDGDLGISMSRAARAIEANLVSLSRQPPPAVLMSLSNIMRRVIAGSSGPFYAVGLGRAAACLTRGDSWADAFDGACAAISELGGASLGDRTMLDALVPAAAAFRLAHGQGRAWLESVRAAAQAAEQGAQGTAKLVARRGRSVYLGDRVLGAPDPGAEAIAVWLRGIGGAPG
jgi:triose/dihydroxyacetone kinase / FAD-AMP lyase (cyclizing)